ncbi:MAG: bifunctional nuclease family protein, partial [Actinobacteria bacterium]|nr:bifunctional nuclease family protein [Actinomycetota bacterium]
SVSARPSDALALALRVKANILVSHELMDSAGIEIPTAGNGESEVEAFKEFLDQINPEDFA